jgi:hypothetical protein
MLSARISLFLHPLAFLAISVKFMLCMGMGTNRIIAPTKAASIMFQETVSPAYGISETI